MAIENSAHLEILIDGSRAKTGADLVKDALESVRLKAQETLQAMQALSKQSISTPRRAASGASGSPQSEVAGHERAEREKTAITQREAAKRATVASTPQFNQLRSEVASLNAAIGRIAMPRIDASEINRQVRSVSTELDRLGAKDLSGLADGGTAAVAKIQVRVAELTRQLDELGKAAVRASKLSAEDFIGPRTRSQARTAEAERLSESRKIPESSPAFVGPISPRQYQADIAALRAAEEKTTGVFKEQAAERLSVWQQSEQEQRRHNQRLAREAAQAAAEMRRADRERQARAFSPSSPAFVGPMPETRRQATERMEKKKALSYDAEAYLSNAAKRVTKTINAKFDTSGAVKQAEHLISALGRVQSAAMSMNGVLAGGAMIVIGRDIARTGMAFDSLQKGLQSATGSSGQATIEMERLRTETNRLGIDLLQTGKEYVSFVAAIQGGNVDVEKAKDAFFATAQAMSLLGRGPQQISLAFKALEQFASKGQIMAEELRGQLAEQLPGAFNITARALGMTAEDLGRAMENGAVSARSFFDVFGEALKGKFPVEGTVQSASASFARFNNALNEIKNTIASGGFLKALAEGADALAKFMNSDVGKKMASDLGGLLKSAIEGLISTFKVLADNIELVKGVALTLIGIKLISWITSLSAAVMELGVQFLLLSKFLMATPLLGIATAVLAGAAAIYAMTRRVTENAKAQLEHNAALKELKDLRSQLKASANDKDEVNDIRAKITAIRDLAREEQKRLDDNIKKMRDAQRIQEAMSTTGLGAEFGGMMPADPNRDADIAREQRERQMARQRAQAAQRALMTNQTGFTGGFAGAGTSATASGVRETAQAEILAKATEQIQRQIAEQDKLFQAFEMNAAAAAELKSQMEMLAQVKMDWGDKVSAEGLKEIMSLMGQLSEAKDRVKAGPIIQELNTSILDLHKLAEAHGKGGDAADKEKVAQEARNRIVEAGVNISSRAAQAIFTLSEANWEAARAADAAKRSAELQQNAAVARATTDVLLNRAGLDRVAGVAQIQEADQLGLDIGDKSPFKKNADRWAPVFEAGKTAAVEASEAQKQQNMNLDHQLRVMDKIIAGEKSRTAEGARRAAEEKAFLELQTRGPTGVGLGSITREELTPEQKAYIEKSGKIAEKEFQASKTPRAKAEKVDRFGEKLRELQESIAAERELAVAYGKGTEAVEQQTRAQSIMNQVHALSEKLTKQQKDKLEELIGTLYDAKTAAAFEGAKMDLRNEIAQIEAMARVQLGSAEAANREAIAQQARDEAIRLGVSTDKEAIRSLEELMLARQNAEQAGMVNQRIRETRDTIKDYEDEANALKLVGQERIRRIAELQQEQELRDQGISKNTPRFEEAVRGSGEVAIREYIDASNESIRSTEGQIDAVGRQSAAMSLLGEAYVRRSAELEKEAELLQANGDATDEYSQKQIKLAGDLAVVSDRLAKQNDSLRQLADSGLTFDQQMREISYGGLMNMEDALVDIITGTKSVKEAFADMARSIAADLARMAIRQAITIPIAMAMNGMFGGMAGAGAMGAMGTMGAMGAMGAMGGGFPMAHTGGIIGQDRLATKSVAPEVFQGAPRFHSGKLPSLAPGETPAILKENEGVFTPGQMKALGPAGGNTSITVSPNVNVNMPQGASQEDGERFGKAITRQLQGMVQEEIRRSIRPGGQLNPNGMG
jgi:tape measure domain-containing protein